MRATSTMHRSTIASLAACLSMTLSGVAVGQMLPQTFKGAQGRYEMCMKRHILDFRKASGQSMEPVVEIASAEAACRKQEPKGGGADDVIASIMECGVARGDGTPDQGCPQ